MLAIAYMLLNRDCRHNGLEGKSSSSQSIEAFMSVADGLRIFCAQCSLSIVASRLWGIVIEEMEGST